MSRIILEGVFSPLDRARLCKDSQVTQVSISTQTRCGSGGRVDPESSAGSDRFLRQLVSSSLSRESPPMILIPPFTFAQLDDPMVTPVFTNNMSQSMFSCFVGINLILRSFDKVTERGGFILQIYIGTITHI